ncbi:MAG: Thiamine-phosphate synthase [Methanonatronarchaeales archaeon]|nr:Thiamine-phosphate synthase [Methanonatronarchaeales archaeon]
MTGLYVLVDTETWFDVVEASVGEVDFVQLRDKDASDRELFEAGAAIGEATEGTSTQFIVNDRVDVALATGADGVHLGEDDLPLDAARELMGDLSIGASVDSVEEAEAAAEVADYVSIGPVFRTESKAGPGKPVGPGGVREVAETVDSPVVAIGGIEASNAAEVAGAGADYVAVLSAVRDEPDREVEELLDSIG